MSKTAWGQELDDNLQLMTEIREAKAESKALKAERDALAAQVEVLTDHRRELLDLIYNNAIGAIAMGYAVDIESMAKNAFSITGIDAPKNREDEVTSPNCFLAEIRAGALEAEADLVLQWPRDTPLNEQKLLGRIAGAMKYRANRIRQGGDV